MVYQLPDHDFDLSIFLSEQHSVMRALVKLLKDVLRDLDTSRIFFFTTDLKVLVEVLMREVSDRTETKVLATAFSLSY